MSYVAVNGLTSEFKGSRAKKRQLLAFCRTL
jgi:hypothetical protein